MTSSYAEKETLSARWLHLPRHSGRKTLKILVLREQSLHKFNVLQWRVITFHRPLHFCHNYFRSEIPRSVTVYTRSVCTLICNVFDFQVSNERMTAIHETTPTKPLLCSKHLILSKTFHSQNYRKSLPTRTLYLWRHMCTVFQHF